MEGQFTAQQIATDAQLRADVVDFLNDQQKAGFCYIEGYSNSQGEVANHWFKGACNYGNMTERSVAMIDDGSIMGHIEENGLHTVRGIWHDEKGNISPTAKESKNFPLYKGDYERTFSLSNNEDKEKLVAAITRLREQFTKPKKVDQGYSKVATGTYEKEGEDGVLYLRDCMTVTKNVITQAVYKQTASKEDTVIRAAMTKLTPRGKYVTYKLDDFQWLKVGGLAILQGSNASPWDLHLAEADAAKDMVTENNVASVVDTILD